MSDLIERPINELTGGDLKLAEAAREASRHSFAPFSNFNVGSALLTVNDKIVCGTNYESATYTLTSHAEQSGLVAVRLSGERAVKSIAVFGKSSTSDANSVCTPCGLCRQLIFEAAQFSGIDIELIMLSSRFDRFIKSTISKLLPLGFSASDFGYKVS